MFLCDQQMDVPHKYIFGILKTQRLTVDVSRETVAICFKTSIHSIVPIPHTLQAELMNINHRNILFSSFSLIL